jgi:hypothetical protein
VGWRYSRDTVSEEQKALDRETFRELGRRRWRGKSDVEKSEHGKMMARAKEKKEAEARAAKERGG